MFRNNKDFNYILGFVVVATLIFISIIIIKNSQKTRYKILTEQISPAIGVTLITNRGPINLDQGMLDHYLTRLRDNIEYVSKRIDVDRCEEIHDELVKAKNSLKSQIQEKSELGNIEQIASIQEERQKLRTRINAMADIMFENDQNPEDTRSILLELIMDVETLLYLTKVIPLEIDSVDIHDVDQVIKLIYETACNSSIVEPYTNEDLKPQEDLIDEEILGKDPGEDTFISRPKLQPGQRGIYADFNKHQDLGDLSHTTKFQTSYKNQKRSLKNLRSLSLDLVSQKQKEKYRESSARKVRVSPQEEGTDVIRDRYTQAKEAFISEHPGRYTKKRNSLIDDYDYMEDATIMPGLAYARPRKY